MNLLKEASELILGIGLFINAGLFVPQAWQLYKTKDAEGLSLITFTGFLFINSTAVINGYFYHNWAMVFGYLLSIITCGVVVALAVYYRRKAKESRL